MRNDEEARLRAVRAFDILDTSPEEAFDDLTLLASAICGTPIATVTIVDRHRQWFKSERGLGNRETPRELSFCAHTIVDGRPLVVPDAHDDPRFSMNPLVTGDPNIRFYAGSPLVTHEGHVLGTICVIDRVPRDLTAAQADALDALARQTMRALEYRRQALQLNELGELIDLAQEAIIVRELDGTIVLWNDGAVALYGHAADDVRGLVTHDLLATGFPQPLGEILAELDSRGVWHGVLRHRTRAGATIVVDSRWVLRRTDDGRGRVLEINTDITERTRLEQLERQAAEALAEQNERLRELDKMKDEFVALVSHELRTPLASIRGYLEVILDEEPGPLTELQRRFLEIVDRSSVRLNRIVDDLLTLASVQAGTLALSRERFDLQQVVVEVLETMDPLAGSKGVALVSDLDSSLPVDADRARISQVLVNLVSNAIKFTPADGRVTIRGAVEGGDVVLDVVDTGIGIPEHELPQLFGRFYRTSAATEGAIPGTGLGLAICRAIADAHGGSLDVAETTERGTTFRLRLSAA